MTTKGRRRGKDLEKFVAKQWAGQRLGILGHDDVRVDGKYSIECKSRERLPVSIRNWMAQAVANCGEMMPLVYMHQTGEDHLDDLVIIRAPDMEWFIKNMARLNDLIVQVSDAST